MKRAKIIFIILFIVYNVFLCYSKNLGNNVTFGSAEEDNEIVDEDLESVDDNNLHLFGAGSNVYWYLKNSNTELHLSGTLPTDPAYAPGQDDYYGVLPGSAATTVTKVVIDNEIHPIYCSSWFSGFTNLDNIENIHWINTSDVIDMSYMFFGCAALTSLDLSTFDTQNVTNMNFMFYYCTNLSDLNISNFNTENVNTMADMFFDCYLLTTLDISSFDTRSLTDASVMFSNAGIQKIYASPSFNISASVGSHMFDDCTSLVGENGTPYTDAHVDGDYARIDTASTPGYFTRKSLTVSFDTDGGSSIAPITAYRGYTISAPVPPIKSGYTFVDWYKESTRTNIWNFSSNVVKNNMILYAKWKVVSGGGGSDGGGGGGGGNGGPPKIDADGNITPGGKQGTVIGLEVLNSGNIGYCTFYKWDYNGKIAKNSNIKYNLNDYKFYNYDLSVVANEWVGFSYFGSKIVWYYTKYDGTVNKDTFMNIGKYIYYFDETGKMVTGRKYIDGKGCYFIESDGAIEGIYISDGNLK